VKGAYSIEGHGILEGKRTKYGVLLPGIILICKKCFERIIFIYRDLPTILQKFVEMWVKKIPLVKIS
jgi:hypothetical protein